MKKIKLLLLLTFVSFAIQAQTNELATATKLLVSSKNLVIQTLTIEYPTAKWDERTAWGSCMNNAARTCAKSWVCTINFAAFSAAYIAGWSLMCATTNQQQIPPTKPL